MGKLTIVTSGKGGSGKSTVSVGLASAYHKKGNNILLIDCDEGLRCLDLMLGVSDKLVFDLSDIINHGKTLDEVVLKVDKNISLIAAPANVNSYDRRAFGKFLSEITDLYDNIIVDCPAGIDREFYSHLPDYSEVLVVETLDAIGCRSASTIENLLYKAGISKKYLIINKFDFFMLKSNCLISLDDIIDKTGLMIKGIIPNDPELTHLSAEGKLFTKSIAFDAFKRISDRLDGKFVKLPKLNNL